LEVHRPELRERGAKQRDRREHREDRPPPAQEGEDEPEGIDEGEGPEPPVPGETEVVPEEIPPELRPEESHDVQDRHRRTDQHVRLPLSDQPIPDGKARPVHALGEDRRERDRPVVRPRQPSASEKHLRLGSPVAAAGTRGDARAGALSSGGWSTSGATRLPHNQPRARASSSSATTRVRASAGASARSSTRERGTRRSSSSTTPRATAATVSSR